MFQVHLLVLVCGRRSEVRAAELFRETGNRVGGGVVCVVVAVFLELHDGGCHGGLVVGIVSVLPLRGRHPIRILVIGLVRVLVAPSVGRDLLRVTVVDLGGEGQVGKSDFWILMRRWGRGEGVGLEQSAGGGCCRALRPFPSFERLRRSWAMTGLVSVGGGGGAE